MSSVENKTRDGSSQLNDVAFQRYIARANLADNLKFRCLIAIGLLFAYSLLILGAFYATLPQRDNSVVSILNWLIALGVGWLSLRLRPLYTAISICVFLGLTTSSVHFSEHNWFKYAISASLFLLVYSCRMRFPTYTKLLADKAYNAFASQQSHAPVEPRSITDSQNQTLGQLVPFILRSLIAVLTLCFLAYTTSFLLATLLSNTPLHGYQAIWRRIAIDSNDQFWPPAWFLTCLIAAAILLVHWDWRRLTPEQASIAVRSQNLAWQYSELRRVLFSRRRLLNKSEKVSDLDS